MPRGPDAKTPLMYAVQTGNSTMIGILVQEFFEIRCSEVCVLFPVGVGFFGVRGGV